MNVNVQFSDSTENTVIAYFGCQQDHSIYPNQAVIDSNDPRFQAFLKLTSAMADRLAMAGINAST